MATIYDDVSKLRSDLIKMKTAMNQAAAKIHHDAGSLFMLNMMNETLQMITDRVTDIVIEHKNY
ncbi:hypothetical protein AAY80_208 [Stenotrophomonas phage vB_SmaS-DLP_6]|nr:hypothetical protein AAY80_208 [Stenotrophomonas phage vB_SmaS-DLP_6]